MSQRQPSRTLEVIQLARAARDRSAQNEPREHGLLRPGTAIMRLSPRMRRLIGISQTMIRMRELKFSEHILASSCPMFRTRSSDPA
jgi:hypothetical protein